MRIPRLSFSVCPARGIFSSLSLSLSRDIYIYYARVYVLILLSLSVCLSVGRSIYRHYQLFGTQPYPQHPRSLSTSTSPRPLVYHPRLSSHLLSSLTGIIIESFPLLYNSSLCVNVGHTVDCLALSRHSRGRASLLMKVLAELAREGQWVAKRGIGETTSLLSPRMRRLRWSDSPPLLPLPFAFLLLPQIDKTMYLSACRSPLLQAASTPLLHGLHSLSTRLLHQLLLRPLRRIIPCRRGRTLSQG